MGHHLTAIVLKGPYSKELAMAYDLHAIDLGFGLTLFPIDVYYSAYWQEVLKKEGELPVPPSKYLQLPCESVLADLMAIISGDKMPVYAILATNYSGGFGYQAAYVFKGKELASETVNDIDQALHFLGVTRKGDLDEFDTVRMGDLRWLPNYLSKYSDLVRELDI